MRPNNPVSSPVQAASPIRTTGAPDEDMLQAVRLEINRGGPLYVRRARPNDLGIITRMIDDAKARLRALGTDQWSTDWADTQGRSRHDRVKHSLVNGKTWVAMFAYQHKSQPVVLPVATVTIEKTANPAVWTNSEATAEPAVYLGRLVTAEGLGGLHIGSRMLDWAGQHSAESYGAKWIRIDVWTSNKALHEYYEKRGFEDCGLVPDIHYPSRKLFQRSAGYDSGNAIKICEVDAPV